MLRIADQIRNRLKKFKLSESDVLWVGSMDGRFRLTWAEFVAGPGKAHVQLPHYMGRQDSMQHAIYTRGTAIAKDLVICGDGWWMQRHPTVGRAAFVLCRAPSYDPEAKPFDRAVGRIDAKLEDLEG